MRGPRDTHAGTHGPDKPPNDYKLPFPVEWPPAPRLLYSEEAMERQYKTLEHAGTTALLLELIPAYCTGILGLGHAFAGRAYMTVLLSFIWWGFNIGGYFLTMLTLGLAGIAWVPGMFAVPVISAFLARETMLREEKLGDWNAVLISLAIMVGLIFVMAALFLSGIFGLAVLASMF